MRASDCNLAVGSNLISDSGLGSAHMVGVIRKRSSSDEGLG